MVEKVFNIGTIPDSMMNQELNIGELIPELSPNVEGKLIICLAKEVKL